MSRRFAQAAVAALKSDSVISAWAEGGILDRDPRRSGPNATKDAFTSTSTGDIKPVIAVVGTSGIPAFTNTPRAISDTFEVRLFVPDHHTRYDALDTIAERIIHLLNRYRAGGERPGIFQYEFRLGIQNGGAFEDVAYDSIRFNVNSIHAPLEATA